jgi:hypothetical protein
MKRIYATILTIGALVASAYAQGTVTFNNSAAAVVKQWTSWTDSTLINVPVGGGRVELMWAAVGTTDLALFSSVAITGFNTVPGRFNGGVVTIPTPVAGGPVALVVRGWTGTSLTWAGRDPFSLIGYSAIWTQAVTGNPTTVPPGTPVSILPGFTGLTLDCGACPEPTSMALTGLGTISLFLFRRRSALVS